VALEPTARVDLDVESPFAGERGARPVGESSVLNQTPAVSTIPIPASKTIDNQFLRKADHDPGIQHRWPEQIRRSPKIF
jgi:hypothetical protein